LIASNREQQSVPEDALRYSLLVREKIANSIDRSVDYLESTLRRAAGLPSEEPNTSPFRFRPSKNPGLVEIEKADPREIEDNYRQWHEEGKKAHYIGKATSSLRSLGDKVVSGDFKAVNKWQAHKFDKELREARQITWEAWHFAREGETDHIDGRLILPSGASHGFDIATAYEAEYWAREGLSMGGVATKFETRCLTATLPGRGLTPALLEIALRAWYVQRFEWEQGHWAVLEKKLPQFIIRAAWEDGSCLCHDERECPDYNEQALESEVTVLEALESDYAISSYRRFGAKPVPQRLRDSINSR
jgi:hypothetical protein